MYLHWKIRFADRKWNHDMSRHAEAKGDDIRNITESG
jgi:hypothetical protein